MQNKKFIDIKNYTKDSLEYGFQSVDEIISAAHERSLEGMGNHVFLTDHNTLFSAPEFISQARDKKLIPVVGLTVSILNVLSKEVEGTLTFYAKNDKGIESLVKIIGKTEKVNGQHCITLSELKKTEPSDLKVLSGGQDSILYNLIKKTMSDDQKIKETGAKHGDALISYFKNVFGQENINYEIQYTETEEQSRINGIIRKMGAKHYVPVIPTFDIRAERKNDMPLLKNKGNFLVFNKGEQYDYQHAINEKSYRGFFNEINFEEKFSIDEMNNLNEFTHDFNDGYSFVTNDIYIPTSGKDLRTIAFEALDKIIIDKNEDEKKIYRDRLEEEYSVIHSLGFDDYFLIFDDIVKNVEDANFMVRGSSIGSLMTYTLGLSNTDPIEYGLLFERFLNKSRASRSEYPDIDLETDKKDEIEVYLKKKYGENGAFLLSDKTSIRSKSSINFVRNSLSDSFQNEETKKEFNNACYELYEPIKKEMYFGAGDSSLREEIKRYPEFNTILNKSKMHLMVAKLAIRSEEQVTGFKKSPASYILVPPEKRKFYSESMLSARDKDKSSTLKALEISKHTVSLLGLVKLDILTNKVLGRLCKLLKERPDIKVDDKMEDANAYKAISNGVTSGIFQIGKQARLCNMVSPKNFEDLVSIMALMRPGISQETHRLYLNSRKRGNVSIHPKIDDILASTHGVILFDEQIMMIAQKVAGYSPGESDNIRSLLKGNKKEQIHLLKPEFIQSGIRNGVDEPTMEKVFNTIEQMCGKYTFSKAHSIAYAKVAYKQAYISYYHPAEYVSSFVLGDTDKKYEMKPIISQLKALNGFKFRLPRPNEVFSEYKSVVENNKVTGIVPLNVLVSVNTYDAIKTAREENQFQSFPDFVKRSLRTVMNAKSPYSFDMKEKKREVIFNTYIKDVENLIKVGIFDHVVKSQEELSAIDKRQALLENLTGLMNHLKEPYTYNYDPVIHKSKNELKIDVSNIITAEMKYLFGESPTAEWLKNNQGSYKSEEDRKNEERIQRRRERAALLAVEKGVQSGNQFFDKASKTVEEQKSKENNYSAPKYK